MFGPVFRAADRFSKNILWMCSNQQALFEQAFYCGQHLSGPCPIPGYNKNSAATALTRQRKPVRLLWQKKTKFQARCLNGVFILFCVSECGMCIRIHMRGSGKSMPPYPESRKTFHVAWNKKTKFSSEWAWLLRAICLPLQRLPRGELHCRPPLQAVNQSHANTRSFASVPIKWEIICAISTYCVWGTGRDLDQQSKK